MHNEQPTHKNICCVKSLLCPVYQVLYMNRPLHIALHHQRAGIKFVHLSRKALYNIFSLRFIQNIFIFIKSECIFLWLGTVKLRQHYLLISVLPKQNVHMLTYEDEMVDGEMCRRKFTIHMQCMLASNKEKYVD